MDNRKYAVEDFHALLRVLADCSKYAKPYGPYIVTIRPGLLDGVCNQRKRDNDTLLPGMKFLQMHNQSIYK